MVSAWSYSVNTLATGSNSITQIVGGSRYIYVTYGNNLKRVSAYDRQLLSTQSSVVNMFQPVNDISSSSNIGYVAYHGTVNGADAISVATNSLPNNAALYWFSCNPSTCTSASPVSASSFGPATKVSGMRGFGMESSYPKLYVLRSTAVASTSAATVNNIATSLSFRAFNDIDYIGSTVSFP